IAKREEYPILMFDDVLADLDLKRTNNILPSLQNCHQLFIATPNLPAYQYLNLPIINLDELHETG
ncbi:MAG: DNA replication and repair protein RecF, partial [Candidatus Cloacimonetes bacterium]|nr:DNA replication and repair protein RecF [Candidatus Cloacimonadota bacterium]